MSGRLVARSQMKNALAAVGGDSPFVNRRHLEILEEEQYLKQMKSSLDRERLQLETGKREKETKMKKEAELRNKYS